MRVYIAAKFEDQAAMRSLAYALQNRYGIFCTSRWLYERKNVSYGKGQPLIQIAQRDLDDIDRADAIVVIPNASGHDTGTVGRHVETGYAIAKRMPVVFVGKPAHTFYTLPRMRVVKPGVGLPERLAGALVRLTKRGK